MNEQGEIPGYKEKTFGSLSEFLNWIYGFGTGTQSPLEGMIFRGVGKANTYKLIPSAFRTQGSSAVGNNRNLTVLAHNPSQPGEFAGYSPCNREIVRAELAELARFYQEANLQGLSLPAVKYLRKNQFAKFHNSDISKIVSWPEESALELMALAQHYGLSTRMLDWTRNINVALYFALSGVIKEVYECYRKDKEMKLKEKEPFCIWGVNLRCIQSIFEDHCGFYCPIRFYTPEYASNPNLRAQEGLLSYQITDMAQESICQPFYVEPIEDELKEYYKQLQERVGHMEDEWHLCKLVFNSTNILEEFEYITKQGYNAAKLFPGYFGVVKKIEEDRIIANLKRAGFK